MAQWSGSANTRGSFDSFDLELWDTVDLASYWWDPLSPGAAARSDVAAAARTHVDWLETDRAHVFKADLPGLSKEDVRLHVEDGRILQIGGELKNDDVDKNDKWHRFERQHGTITRRFRLPENAKLDKAKANMENGVLTVTVPKTAETKPNKKAIEVFGNLSSGVIVWSNNNVEECLSNVIKF